MALAGKGLSLYVPLESVTLTVGVACLMVNMTWLVAVV
jgi:hypothetical protein